MTWKIEARRLPIPDVPGVGDIFGHLYIEVWNSQDERVLQINGLAQNPSTGEIEAVGYDGYKIPVVFSNPNIPPFTVPFANGYNRSNHPYDGTLLFQGSQEDVLKALDYAASAANYLNAQDYRYQLIPHSNFTDNDGMTVPYYNSNAVFNSVVLAMQQAVPILQSSIDAAKDMGVVNPGSDHDMYHGVVWSPNEEDLAGADLQYAGGREIITGTEYFDKISGSSTGETLKGAGGGDSISGLEGNDSLEGNNGSDTLIGGAGNDIIHGGEGFDWLMYDESAAQGINLAINVSLSSTLHGFTGGVTEVINIQVEDTINGGTTTTALTGNDGFTGIDGIVATNFNDTITINDSISGDQFLSLYLGLGNNIINLSNNNDTTLNIFFNTTKLQDDSNGAFANSLAAGTLSIYGYGGNDDIYGSAFADTIVGGQGDDTLRGFGGGDTFIFSNIDGEDTIVGSDKNDKIFVDGGAVELKGTLTESYTTDWDYQLLQSNNDMAYFKWSGDSTVPGSSGDLEVDFDGTFYYDILIKDFSNGDFGLDIEGAASGFEDPIDNDPNDPINPFFTIPTSGLVSERTDTIGGNTVISTEPGAGEEITPSFDTGIIISEDDEGIESFTTPGYGFGGHWLSDGKTGGYKESDDDNDPYSPGASKGDPHLLTYDGLFYDFQNTGEFTLTQSTDTNPFTIQARMQEWDLGDAVGDLFSVNTAIATQVGDDTIGFYIDGSLSYDFEVAAQDDNPYNDQHPNLFINDSAYFMADYSVIFLGDDDGYLYRKGNEYTVVNAYGDTLRVEVHNTHLDMVSFAANSRTSGSLEGLLGNYDGDTTNEYKLDDGTDLGSTISVDTLYNTFGEDWRITQAESLFLYDDGQTTSSFDNPYFIPDLKTLADFDPAVVTAAQAAVEAEGFDPNSDVFDAAVLDYIVMGDITYTASWQLLELHAGVTDANVTNTTINGIDGTANPDSLIGTAAVDVIHGYEGNDTIYGRADDDTLVGGVGDDYIDGEGGYDTFLHYVGDGNDTLVDDQDGFSAVAMMGVDAEDIYFNVDGDHLIATNINNGESVTMMWQYYNMGAGLPFGTFNGQSLAAGLTIRGTSATAGETVEGSIVADTIIGGLGNDALYGNGGTNHYVHEVGDGNDTITEERYSYSTIDMDISSNDNLYFNVDGNDLIVTNTESDEFFTLKYQYYYSDSTYFGSINGMDVTGGITIKGTSATAGENIFGTEFADTIISGLGDDVITTNGGGDTIVHAIGDGNDTLHADLGELAVIDMQGIDAADLRFNVSDYSLEISNTVNSEVVTLVNQYYNTSSGYKFSSVNGIDLTGSLPVYGTENNDSLTGTSGDDALYGGAGNDTLKGGAGDDTLVGGTGDDIGYGEGGLNVFIHELGDGSDVLYENRGSLSVVEMNGANANDLYFSVDGNHLVATNVTNGDSLKLMWQYYYSDSTYFGTFNGIDITGGITIKGTSATAAETIEGTSYDDTIIGGLGDDYLITEGQDTVVHNIGDGNDLISGNYGDKVVIDMVGVATQDIEFYINGNNLQIIDSVNNEVITLYNHYSYTNYGFKFGSVNGIDLTEGLTLNGDASDNTINGSLMDELFNAGAGNDVVYAEKGNDTVYGGTGNDYVFGDDDNDLIMGEAGDDTLRGDDENDTLWGGTGHDSLLGGNHDDVLYGEEGNDSLNGGNGADIFVFGANSGVDLISDFDEGTDLLHFDSGVFATAAEAVAAFSSGSIDLGTGNSVTLQGVSTLTEADIVIV